MNRSAIANNIKHLRLVRHWSQEELALASGVDVRTVQRAESGKPLAVETLKSLAAVFDTTIELLQVSEKEIVAAVEEFRRTQKIVEMHVLARSSELGEMVGGSHALYFHKIGELSETQLDQIAKVEEILRDYLDIWGDMEATGRREAEKSLYANVEQLIASEMSVSFGFEQMGIRMGDGQPFTMPVLYVAIARGSTPMLAIIRPKNMPVSFSI